MQKINLDYGDGKLPIDLPDTAEVVRYGSTYTDPPMTDARIATRKALDNPLGFKPLWELGGPDKKAVIAFPDRVKGGAHENAHRKVAIPMIVEDLLRGGTKIENITLLCSMGLHRKNTLEEWYWYLGKDIVDRFYPGRIVNHDAEAPDLCDFGEDAMGNRVQCNRIMAEADIPILVGHCAGNPYGGFSGGYKMVVTGMSGWKSIASHHCPSTMHRSDWLGASTESHMRHQFKSIGQAMEKAIGKKFFTVDAVLGQYGDVLDVQAGLVDEVEKATWPLATKRTSIELDHSEPFDVLVMGLPRNFHYGPGMGSNPILMSLAIAGQLSRCWRAMHPESVIIASAVCDGWFNDSWFPSYKPTYEAMQNFTTVPDFLESDEMLKIATDPDYCYRYSANYTYHPFHAMSMLSGGSVSNLWCSKTIIVGAGSPGYARGMGFTPVKTFDDAMSLARRSTGKNPRVLCTPECFSGGSAVHLGLKNS